jgi:hexosaminidase
MKRSIELVVLTLVLAGCGNEKALPTETSNTQIKQSELDSVANKLVVKYTLVANKGDGDCLGGLIEKACFIADINLKSPTNFIATGWEIYFSQTTPVVISQSEEFVVERINGDLHRILPTGSFTGFKAGEEKVIRMASHGLIRSEAAMLPNYYIMADGLEARNIESTRLSIDPETGLEVRPYASAIDPVNQFKADSSDATPLATAEFLYGENKDTVEDRRFIDTVILPSPARMKQYPGRLDISNGIKVHGNTEAINASAAAVKHLESMGLGKTDNGVVVNLSIEPDTEKVAGSYRLRVSKKDIQVTGVDAAGVANGVQSLASLVTLGQSELPLVEVEDEPRYEFRGMHVDVARNFHSKQFILDLLDQMAAYKLNKLHLHLGEDEAWRLEVKDLPELTDVGSKRCHDPEENDCLMMQLGSGINNETLDGYYTIEDYIEIVRAANSNHIQVIPSFDMP